MARQGFVLALIGILPAKTPALAMEGSGTSDSPYILITAAAAVSSSSSISTDTGTTEYIVYESSDSDSGLCFIGSCMAN